MNELSALDILKHPQSGDESDIKEAMICAISALEKQMLKKIKIKKSIAVIPKFQPNGTILGEETEIREYYCPLCNGVVDVQYGTNVYSLDEKFCSCCGQALDWSDTDE